jgi:16S rRNA (guanine1207-N2)-methyltransferase
MNINPTQPYEEVSQFSARLGEETMHIISKPGLPEWGKLRPSTELLAENSALNPGDFVLLYGCHQGALAVYLARNLSKDHLSITDINYTSLEVTQMNLAANKINSVNLLSGIELPQELYQKFNDTYIHIPKGRLLTRRWLLQAYTALVFGGSLYIGGSNNSGIQSVLKDTQELFGQGRILAYKKGNRVAKFIKKLAVEPIPHWAQVPGIVPYTWVEFSIPFSNYTFRIRSLPGVFSFDHLDAGTKTLLSVLNIPPAAKVLDVGCGYGILGMYAAASGAGLVHFIDNNLHALAACRETITLNGITNAEVFAGDLLEPIGTHKYDLILTNPPFHAGHAVDYRIAQAMIEQSYHALNPGSQMIIVANRFIRYDRLIKEIFGNVSTLVESGKFHVLSGLKSR